MTNIVLTGAIGFIGKHLAPALCRDGQELFEANSASGDVGEKSTWLRFPQAEVAIHLAGKAFVQDSWADPTAFIMQSTRHYLLQR